MNCKSCGRKLTSDESLEHGYGPVCYARIYGKQPKKKRKITDFWKDYNVPGQITIDEWLRELRKEQSEEESEQWTGA